MLCGVADRPVSIRRVEAVLGSFPEEEDCKKTVHSSSSVAAVSKKD